MGVNVNNAMGFLALSTVLVSLKKVVPNFSLSNLIKNVPAYDSSITRAETLELVVSICVFYQIYVLPYSSD